MRRLSAGSQRHVVDILFTLALFCVFAASSLMVVLIGANVYRSTVRGMDRNFETSTSLTYVGNKIRQHDETGAVYLDRIEGVQALVLETVYDGTSFQTWIYHSDGALRELLVFAGDTVRLRDGQPIVEVEDFAVDRVDDGLYSLRAVGSDGDSAEVLIQVQSDRAGG